MPVVVCLLAWYQVNFLQWKRENNHRELQVLRRYHIQDRDDYSKYNKVAGLITKLVSMLKTLAADDPARIEITDLILEKLKNMGIISTKKSLSQLEEVSTSAFCRRRLPIVMVRSKMAETVPEAVTFVEQVGVKPSPSLAQANHHHHHSSPQRLPLPRLSPPFCPPPPAPRELVSTDTITLSLSLSVAAAAAAARAT